MNRTENSDELTVGMLLDIEHVYGNHEGRLAPILVTMILCLLPVLIYVYFSLFLYIPVWVFAPIEVIYAARVIMLIPGRESYRVANYKKRLYDDYTDIASMMRIKTIYEDGLVEYVNGKVFYAVKCYNGTCEDELFRSQQLRKFLASMAGDFEFDVYILNENSTASIRRYYKNISRFGRGVASLMFTKIVDLLSNITKHKSMVQCTVFIVKGRRSDWKQMRMQIDGAISSQNSKAFKHVYRVKEKEDLIELVDQDMDTSVNMTELLRAKYKTGEYYTSKVIAYDPKDEVVIGKIAEEPKPVKKQVREPHTNKSTFHVAYKEPRQQSDIKKAEPKPGYYEPVTLKQVKEPARTQKTIKQGK